MQAEASDSRHVARPMRRTNGFDTDVAPLVPALSRSADTSTSSVLTEPHRMAAAAAGPPEPSSRRRVPSQVTPFAAQAPQVADADPPKPKQNNPYLYNVLGANASPDLLARTSPIPGSPGTGSPNSPLQPQRNAPAAEESIAHPWDGSSNLSLSAHPPVHALPPLGGYMATCYSSAFPPGHLPQLDDHPTTTDTSLDFPREPAPETRGSPTSSRGRRSRRYPKHQAPEGVEDYHKDQESCSTRSTSPIDTNSPKPVSPTTMTRVYRNGRPIPVPVTSSHPATAADVTTNARGK